MTSREEGRQRKAKQAKGSAIKVQMMHSEVTLGYITL